MTRRIDASFGVQTAYTLRSVWGDLVKRKFGTLLTILVIAVSLTIPTVSYLLWKNLHLATTQFLSGKRTHNLFTQKFKRRRC